LDAEGKEDFSVNFKNVSKKVYQNILIRKGINSNSPNYAIWQGEIDRLILKDPLQLTSLI
jgi:chromosome segregation ATPase